MGLGGKCPGEKWPSCYIKACCFSKLELSSCFYFYRSFIKNYLLTYQSNEIEYIKQDLILFHNFSFYFQLEMPCDWQRFTGSGKY